MNSWTGTDSEHFNVASHLLIMNFLLNLFFELSIFIRETNFHVSHGRDVELDLGNFGVKDVGVGEHIVLEEFESLNFCSWIFEESYSMLHYHMEDSLAHFPQDIG